MKYFVCLIMFIGSAKAAEFCVTGGGDLLAAINTADNNNQADHIKVSEGSYTTPPGGYIFETTQNDDLEISGGWTSFMGNDCGQQLAGSPFDTTIDANQSGRVMRIRTGPHANITLSGMNFINGFLTGPGNNTGSLLIDLGYSVPEVSPTGKVVIERMSFLNNNAFGSGAVYVNNADTIVFRNNLLAANNSESGSSVIGLLAEDDMNGVYVINNTIYGNSGGLYSHTFDNAQVYIVNNLLWNNNGSDLRMIGDGYKYMFNNNVEVIVSDQHTVNPNESSGNWSIPPLFEPGILNFTPSVNSPLVGFGKKPPFIVPIPTPFHLDWYVGAEDFEGNIRETGNRVDIGAFESPYQEIIEIPLFMDDFED